MQEALGFTAQRNRVLGIGDVGIIFNYAFGTTSEGLRQECGFARTRRSQHCNIATGQTVQGTLKLVHGCFYGLIEGFIHWKLMTTSILQPCFPPQAGKQLLTSKLDETLGVSNSTEEGLGQMVQICLSTLLRSRYSHLEALQVSPKLKLAILHKGFKICHTQTTCDLQSLPCWSPSLGDAPVDVWECLLGRFPHLVYKRSKVTWCGRWVSNRHMLRSGGRRDVISY